MLNHVVTSNENSNKRVRIQSRVGTLTGSSNIKTYKRSKNEVVTRVYTTNDLFKF